MISFTVYGQPAPAGSKTAGRTRDGRTFIRDSSKTSYPWKQRVEQIAGETMQGLPLFEGPLILGLEFYVPRPKGHFGARGLRPSAPKAPITRPDLLKLARAIEDALTGIVYRDDSQIVREILDKFYGEPARCEVRLYRMDQQTINSGPGEEVAA